MGGVCKMRVVNLMTCWACAVRNLRGARDATLRIDVREGRGRL